MQRFSVKRVVLLAARILLALAALRMVLRFLDNILV